jgi:subtilisin family serine protease
LPGVDDDGNGYIDDFHGWNFLSDNNSLADSSGHGSHVAGTVVGATEDISQVSSTSDDERVKVMVLKFLDGDGVGTTADAIEAIQYAVDNGAKILNNSWGGTGYSALLHEAVVYSFFQNTLFVAAAGNNGSNNDQQAIYPASYDVPNVLSVAATNDQDDLAFFSNFGSESVDVAAPGVNIVSVAPGGGFYSSSGTSMATPFTAGLAALMVQEAPHFSGFQLKRDIIASVDTFSSLSERMVSGGRVNFLSAVNLAIANSGEATFLPDYTPNYDYSSRDLASLSDGDDGGFGCGRVKNLYEHQNNQIERSSMTLNQVFALALLFMPFLALAYFRKKMKNKRRYKRYQVEFDGVLKTQSGEAIEVEVVCFSIGGAGVRIKKAGAKINLHHEMELFLETDSGKRAFTCRAVSNFKNHFGLCFD